MIAIRLSPANRDRIRASIPDTILPDEDLTTMLEEYGNRPLVEAIYFTPEYEATQKGTDNKVTGWGTIPSRYLREHFELDNPIDDMNYMFVKITRK